LTRKFVPILVVLALALLGLAVTASAHKKLFSSDISAQLTDPQAETLTISGTVTSPKKICLKGRKVIATAFSKTEFETETVGQATSDASGAFQFDLDKGARSTIVLVEVVSKRIPPKTKKHKHTCGEASTAVPVT
jgi:hypothetical protein